MARAYSHDLRVRVLDAVRAGLCRRAAALRYQVDIATVIRWAAHAASLNRRALLEAAGTASQTPRRDHLLKRFRMSVQRSSADRQWRQRHPLVGK